MAAVRLSTYLFLLGAASISSPLPCLVLADAALSSLNSPPIGLKNLGNTCYMNAQLQCHFHIPRVRQLIMATEQTKPSVASDDEGPDSVPMPDSESESSALQGLRSLFREMDQSPFPVAPSMLCRMLGINVYEQQDSQEFWKLLLPAINIPTLTDLYQGAYIDYIVALDGSNREKRQEETFLDLSLDVQDTESLEKALERLFGAPELLSAAQGNGWRPEKGNDMVDANKGSMLTSYGLPCILQFHLKRFQFDWETETTRKLNDPFRFPLKLELGFICKNDETNDTQDSSSLVYDLQGIVVHVGEYGTGHYYAYVRTDITSERWYRFNDHQVDCVSWDEVINDAGNMVNDSSRGLKAGNGLFSRIRRVLFPPSGSHGYGGPTSNAYVLQYVRRSDVPMLYSSDTRYA